MSNLDGLAVHLYQVWQRNMLASVKWDDLPEDVKQAWGQVARSAYNSLTTEPIHQQAAKALAAPDERSAALPAADKPESRDNRYEIALDIMFERFGNKFSEGEIQAASEAVVEAVVQAQPAPLTGDHKPTHRWNGVDGHDCVDCPPVSIWKCDIRAHGGPRTDEHGRLLSTPAEQLRWAAEHARSLVPPPDDRAEGDIAA
jgi:hypothetical protein